MQLTTQNFGLRLNRSFLVGVAAFSLALLPPAFAPNLQLTGGTEREETHQKFDLSLENFAPHSTSENKGIDLFELATIPASNKSNRIELSNTSISIEGTGSIPVGTLSTFETTSNASPHFRFAAGGEHNDFFAIEGDTLRYKNLGSQALPDFNVRIEAFNTETHLVQDFSISVRTPPTERHATWQAERVETLDVIGYGEYVAHYANARDQGWDLSVIGNAGIAFSQTGTGFEIAAVGSGQAGHTASISEISVRPNSPHPFRLDSLGITAFSAENSNVTIFGYREGIAVATALTSTIEELPRTAPIPQDLGVLDEIVLTFHPAIETAELLCLVTSELK